MAIRIGDKYPDLEVKCYFNGEWQDVSTTDLLRGKKSIIFGLPGAYTPTCTSAHIPGFLHNYNAIKEKGIDQIICLSVNDPFVMEQWIDDMNINDRIIFIADGNGILTGRLELEIMLYEICLGLRSKRYTMILEDACVTHFLLDEDVIKCDLSSAENILKIL
jgi:peroxiredoxin